MGSVERAIRKELRDLGVASVAPGLVASAINLAKHQDAAEAPTAAAAVARDLRRVMQDLRRLAPPMSAPDDVVDQIAEQRARRRGEEPRSHGRRTSG